MLRTLRVTGMAWHLYYNRAAQRACRDRAPNVSGGVHPMYCVSSFRMPLPPRGVGTLEFVRRRQPSCVSGFVAYPRTSQRNRCSGCQSGMVYREASIQEKMTRCRHDVSKGDRPIRSAQRQRQRAADGLQLNAGHGYWIGVDDALSRDFRRTPSHTSLYVRLCFLLYLLVLPTHTVPEKQRSSRETIRTR